jgi:dipeptidyl aminopeptidase/acylaminoacyl peptidase
MRTHIGRVSIRFAAVPVVMVALLVLAARAATSPGLVSADLFKLKSVGDVQISPDGKRIAFTLQSSERPGRPISQVWIWDAATGVARQLGTDRDAAASPRWSPDSQWLAYFGRIDDQSGLGAVRMDGSDPIFLGRAVGTNHPLPSTGEALTWSSGSSRIAFLSATPGPEANDANGDPMVITRYLYKPSAAEGLTRFNDNRRLHIWMVDLLSREPRQLTDGAFNEHSLDWSPKNDQVLFVSNREPDADRVFNYDVFTLTLSNGGTRRLSNTKSAEYDPVWSPDGKSIAMLATKRLLTSSETSMEDTHVWVMNADGSNRKEVGSLIDNRQEAPRWSPDGKSLLFTVQERGDVRLYRLPVAGGAAEAVAPEAGQHGSVGSWSMSRGGAIAFSMTTPGSPAELYLKDGASPARKLTSLNEPLLAGRQIAEVEPFTFKSADGIEVEAFLTKPIGLTPTSKHPLIVVLHGGPHGQQGAGFASKAQVYAGRGWATLMVNYRGSTGYGQKFADLIFKDQDGAEGRDVISGVDAALTRYPWLDANRTGIEGVSYGGQLTNWLITQTNRFKAAIPLAGISNLVSFNYTAYYHDYLAVEFGSYPHEQGLIDLLWERSPLRYANKVKTPTLILHGENDNDVPIGEAEQFFIALKDVGVETVLVRYPREGHGLRETKHVVDALERSIVWYEKFLLADLKKH